MDYLDRLQDEKDELDSYINYFYESAKKIVEGGKLYGFPVNINNDKEVIACLFCMYLSENSLRKDFQTEAEFNLNV